MAIKINKPLETSEGFAVDTCFGFLNIYLLNDSWCNISYFKSEADYVAGKQSLNLPNLPSRVSLSLDAETFWGTALAESIHEVCVTDIEAVTGAGTCEIVTLEPPTA
jgi:hypothetical protein